MFGLSLSVIFIIILIVCILLYDSDFTNNKKQHHNTTVSKVKQNNKIVGNNFDTMSAYLSYSDQYNDSYHETLRIVNSVLSDEFTDVNRAQYEDIEDSDETNYGKNINIDSEESEIKELQQIKGDIYQQCPCKDGLICDEGVCKKRLNSPCFISSECAGESVCHKGFCATRPGEWEVPISNVCQYGLIVTNNHLSILKDDSFKILPYWLLFENTVSICKYDNNRIIVITKDKLYLLNTEKYVDNIKIIKESKRPFSHLFNHDRLINHENRIYFIRGSKIYLMKYNIDNSVIWKLDDTIKLNNLKLEDGTTIFKIGKKYVTDDNLLRTIIRNSFADQSLPTGHLDIGIEMTKNIIQLVKSPDKDIIVCLNRDNSVIKYNYKTREKVILQGRGKKLIVCNGNIWLITDQRCVSV